MWFQCSDKKDFKLLSFDCNDSLYRTYNFAGCRWNVIQFILAGMLVSPHW